MIIASLPEANWCDDFKTPGPRHGISEAAAVAKWSKKKLEKCDLQYIHTANQMQRENCGSEIL